MKSKNELPLAARRFDELPGSALVDVRVVALVFGVSVATVWRRSASGLLAKPTRAADTNTTRWKVADVRAAMGQASQAVRS